jgi:hypothetical protein
LLLAACGKPKDPVARGKAYFVGLGCITCHRVGDRGGGQAGPDLTFVGYRKSPEWMDLWRPGEVPPAENVLLGAVREVIYRGETIHVLVGLPDGEGVTVALRNEGQLSKPLAWRRGDSVAVGWLPEDCQVLEEG